jgi:hypothetical protein
MGIVADNAHAQQGKSFCAAFFKKRPLSLVAVAAGAGTAGTRTGPPMVITAMAVITAMVMITVVPPDAARQAEREKSKRRRREDVFFHTADMTISGRIFNVHA